MTPKSSLETSLNATINYFPFEQVGAWSKTDFTELVKATVIINEDDIRRHQPTKLRPPFRRKPYTRSIGTKMTLGK